MTARNSMQHIEDPPLRASAPGRHRGPMTTRTSRKAILPHFVFARRRSFQHAFAVALLLSFPTAALADDDDSAPTSGPAVVRHIDQAKHFDDCLGLLLSDGKAHAEQCGPSGVPDSGPLVPTVGGGDGGGDDG